MDKPDSARKIQEKPIPRLGGLAIFLAVIICVFRNFQFSKEIAGLITAGTIMYVIGLIDDIKPQKASLRLAVQILAGLIVIKCGISIAIIPVSWPFKAVLDGMITIIWLIGMTNAINFMDGIDGLASSMILLSSVLFFLIALPTHQNHLSYICITLAGACAGFLPYNWNPAKIYLGDAGSTFIGFMIAGLSIMGSWAHNNPMVAISTPLLILGIPIFDMIYTTISRIKNGSVKSFTEWLEFAARDHFHHRLMHLKLSVKQTVLFILALNLTLGLGAITIRDTGTKGSALILIQSIIFFIIIVVLMLIGRELTYLPKEERGHK